MITLVSETQNMTLQSLFNIILKVLGLIFLKDLFVYVPQLIIFFSLDDFSTVISSILIYLSIIVLYLVSSYILIFKTNYLIKKLKLIEGFEDNFIETNIHRSVILKVVVMILGGLLIVNEIPNLFIQLFNYFKLKKDGYREANISYSLLAAAKLFVGIILIVYQRHIVNFIEYKKRTDV